jgi:phosphoglycolate phosphatase-like HAD superfamily hydrolase
MTPSEQSNAVEQDWRRLAELVAAESDPQRLSELVEQLIAALDARKQAGKGKGILTANNSE